MTPTRYLASGSLAALMLAAAAPAPEASELRIGLQDDPDILDTDLSRTFVGRIVYTGLCDKLVDIDPELNIVPQLATEWEWNDDETVLTMQLRDDVVFHDGTAFDAEAAVYNLRRSLDHPESLRRSEIASISEVEATGEHTIEITLSAPDATLLAQLSDRAGMMISPDAAEEAGDQFGNDPVCSGPFRFVERVQQDRIVLERFEDYWNADEIHLDRVVYQTIPDTTVRLANLRAGDINMLERLAPTDRASAENDASLTVTDVVGLGYQGITINTNNGPRADNPLGNHKEVRQALELAIDREALTQVVFEGAYPPGNQHVPPDSVWYDENHPMPGRDVDRARELLAEAGYPDGIDIEIQMANNPVQTQVMEVVQAMAGEAGIRISLQAKEFASMLQDQQAGDFVGSQVGWSGRTDPDGNLHQFVTCEGGQNDGRFCSEEVDRLLNEARATNDADERRALYAEAQDILRDELPIIYLYHQAWIWAMRDGVEGFEPYPDGMIRLEGVRVD